MKIGTLRIENFLTIGEATIELADRGLCLIQGDNRDDTSAISNGAGKSSIADAVCWCLFGTTARGESGDDVINNTAGKNCMVSVGLIDEGDIYQVVRSRKHFTGKNGVKLVEIGTGAVVDLTKGTDKLTQVEIEKVLGCTFDVFRASIYAGQDQMPDLPGMTDKNLKILVEEAAGTTILDRAYEEARTRITAAKGEFQVRLNTRMNAGVRITDARARAVSLTGEHIAWAKTQTDAIAARAAERLLLAGQITALAGHIATLQKDVIKKEITELDAKIAAFGGELDEERKLAAALGIANGKVTALKASMARIKASHGIEVTNVADAEHKIGCPCDDCGRPLTADEIAPLKASLSKIVDRLADEFAKTKAQAIAAINEQKALTDSLDAFRATMTDTTVVSDQRASLYRSLNAINDKETELKGKERDSRDCDGQIDRMLKTVNPFTRQIEVADAAIVKCEEDLTEAQSQADLAAQQLANAEVVGKVFSPTGVRGKILDDVTPFLNDQTAIYLGTLSDGNISATWTTLVKNAKGELREKFGIEVEKANGGKKFGLISGGEKRKVRIAAMLALQDLVSRRASKQIDLFIGDEIDDALDNAGIERLMMILEEKARERGSVFMISHSDLKDWISQQMTVVREGGISRIEEVMS